VLSVKNQENQSHFTSKNSKTQAFLRSSYFRHNFSFDIDRFRNFVSVQSGQFTSPLLDIKKPSHSITREKGGLNKNPARPLFNPQYTFSVEMWQRVF
jgi:hypothetical protein